MPDTSPQDLEDLNRTWLQLQWATRELSALAKMPVMEDADFVELDRLVSEVEKAVLDWKPARSKFAEG